MIFDRTDYDFLKLCALCRYMPFGLHKRYDAPFLKRSVIYNLQMHGLIKKQSDNTSYKLTTDGKRYLAEMGSSFPEDARMDLTRTSYKRKLESAETNLLFHLAGIDVFAQAASELKETGYISSLMMRTDKNMKVLGGTRFLGILKIFDTLYIPYSFTEEDMRIIPHFEKEIYTSQSEKIKGVKYIKAMLFGRTLEELWEYMYNNKASCDAIKGRKRLDKALEEMGCDALLVSYGRGGVMQMNIMKIYRYKERIASAMGCVPVMQRELSECDGMIGGTPCIVAFDLDIERIKRALKQVETYNKDAVAKIVCMEFQKSTVFKILKYNNCPKSMVAAIDKYGIYRIFPELEEKTERRPYMTEEGKYIEVNARTTKAFDAQWEDK